MTSLQVSGTHHTRALQRLLPGGSGLWVGGGLHHVKSNFGEFEGSGKHGGRVEGVEGKQEGGAMPERMKGSKEAGLKQRSKSEGSKGAGLEGSAAAGLVGAALEGKGTLHRVLVPGGCCF
eukprot:590380-Pelagomonas_calceolata.AAC.4